MADTDEDRPCRRMGTPYEACDGKHALGAQHNDNLACANPPCSLHGRGREKCSRHARTPAEILRHLLETAEWYISAIEAEHGDDFEALAVEARAALSRSEPEAYEHSILDFESDEERLAHHHALAGVDRETCPVCREYLGLAVVLAE